MSQFTEDIDRLNVTLREKKGKARNDAYKAVLERGTLLHQLSRKVDQREDINEEEYSYNRSLPTSSAPVSMSAHL